MDKKNDKKENSGLFTLALMFMLVSVIPMWASMGTSQNAETEEVVEEATEEEAAVEEPEEVNEDLFETVYIQSATYKVVRFVPTDVLYGIANRGDLVPLTMASGQLLTYEEFLRLTSEEE